MIRAAFAHAHRYAGLTIAGFLIVAGLTGTVIAFERELETWLNPELFLVSPSGKEPIPVDDLVSRVEAASDARVTAIFMPLHTDAAMMMNVDSTNPNMPLGYDQVFINPVTGAWLGERQWGACCFERKQIVPFLFHLHYSLQLPGQIGVTLMGVVGIIWFLDSFSGLVLAWPRGNRVREGWKRTLSIKPGARGYRLYLDIHRAGAMWLWLLFLTMAFTSATVTFREEITEPAVRFFSTISPRIFEESPPRIEGGPLTFGNAVEHAMAAARAVMENPKAAYVAHSPNLNVYGVAVAPGEQDPRDGLGPSWFYIDASDGHVRSRVIAGKGTAGDIFLQAQLPIHTGKIGDLPGRVLVSVLGLATVLLSVTGILIWRKKTAGKAKGKKT